jgi:hypothetical protein
LLPGRCLQQRRHTIESQCGVGELSLGLLHRGGLGSEVGLEWRLLQHIQQVALFHL